MDEPKEINEGARKATEGAVSVFAHLLSRARVIFSSLVFLKVVTKGSSPPFGKWRVIYCKTVSVSFILGIPVSTGPKVHIFYNAGLIFNRQGEYVKFFGTFFNFQPHEYTKIGF